MLFIKENTIKKYNMFYVQRELYSFIYYSFIYLFIINQINYLQIYHYLVVSIFNFIFYRF